MLSCKTPFLAWLSRVWVLGLWFACGLAQAAPVSTFTINVPKRAAGQLEIAALKITLQLNDATNIALRVDGPNGVQLTTSSLNLAVAGPPCFANGFCFEDFGLTAGSAVRDSLVVIKPQDVGADPASADNRKVVLLLQLSSNLNEGAALCNSTMPGDETWTVSVTSAPAARIEGVAVQSLDRNVGGCPTTSYRPIPVNDGPVATVTSPAPVFTSGRVGIDAVLVLDKSGSMNALDGTATTRLAKLKTATNQFLTMWDTLRTSESGNLIVSPTDTVGIVFFDHAASWITNLPTGGLVPFNNAALPGLTGAVNGVLLGGSTSIGNGLITAVGANGLPATGGPNRRVVLLMTDGAQNTPKFAFAQGSEVKTSDDSGNALNPVTLPKQPFQLYTVTVGNEFGPDAPINQALATATGGYTLNTTAPGVELDAFFLQTLQNYHKFSTLEVMRIIQDSTRPTVPFSTLIPVTSGTSRLAFNLRWEPRAGRLRLVLVPPGGGTPLEFDPTTGAVPGTLTASLKLPLQGSTSPVGDWTLRVLAIGEGSTPVPFNLMLMGDDATINSSLAVGGGVHAVGGRIKLTAQINDFGKTLKGLNLQPGAVVKAIVVSPGNNVGDVLSDSNAQPAPSPAGDTATPAQNKLTSILAANPTALVRGANEFILRDDGAAANGDDVAGDGVYSASVPADFEGHYNVVFVVEGRSASGGKFVRQQIRTVHVRSLPDGGTTQYSTSVIGVGDSQQLVVVATPRNVRGGKMGPGWANYFWFASPGRPAVKPVDNLNGTYTARIPFSGATPPAVSVHFLDEPAFRHDGFVAQPGDLTPSNTVTANVGSGGSSARYAIWGGVGVAIPGNFHSVNDSGVAATLGVEAVLSPNLSAEATLGTHRFDSKGGNPDARATVFGIDGKWYFTPPQPMRFFAVAGIGVYNFNPGSTRLGGMAGLGAQFQLSPQWSLEARYGLHGVLNNAPYSSHSTLQLAARYAF